MIPLQLRLLVYLIIACFVIYLYLNFCVDLDFHISHVYSRVYQARRYLDMYPSSSEFEKVV